MMLDHLELNYWAWWVGALVLFGLEILVPGIIFLWLGIAAAIVGGVAYFWADISWQWQLALFAVLAVISTVGGRMLLNRWPIQTSDSELNARGSQYVGRVFTLLEPMDNGYGKVKIGDLQWTVQGDFDAEIGTKVRVTEVKGVVLIVQKALKRPADEPPLD